MSAMTYISEREGEAYEWAVVQWDYKKEGHKPNSEPLAEDGWKHMWSSIEMEACFGVYRRKKHP